MTEMKVMLTVTGSDGEKKKTEVGLAYCYATEISYRDMSGEDITDFMQESAGAIGAKPPRMPDAGKSIYAILAAAIAYAKAKGEEPVITDHDLMFNATPQELGAALGTVIGLRAQFYHIPGGEPEDKPESKKGKKKKNA